MDPNFPYALAPAPLREHRRMQLDAWARERPLTPTEQTERETLAAQYEQDTREHMRMWALEEIERLQGLDAAQQQELDTIRTRVAADIAAEREELNAQAVAWGQKPPFPTPAPEPPPRPAHVVPFVKTPRKKRL